MKKETTIQLSETMIETPMENKGNSIGKQSQITSGIIDNLIGNGINVETIYAFNTNAKRIRYQSTPNFEMMSFIIKYRAYAGEITEHNSEWVSIKFRYAGTEIEFMFDHVA